MMLPKWLVYCFEPMAKEPRMGRQIMSSQVRLVIRQVRSVLSNQSWLAGGLQRAVQAASALSGKAYSGASVLSAQDAGMAEHVLHTQRHWPRLYSTMAGVPKKREAAAGEGNITVSR